MHKDKFDINAVFPVLGYPYTKTSLISIEFSSSPIPVHKYKFDINAVFPIPGYPYTKTSMISMQFFQFPNARTQRQV